MEKDNVFQQISEAWEKSKFVVVCLWPESKAIGPIYGYDRQLTYGELTTIMEQIVKKGVPKKAGKGGKT